MFILNPKQLQNEKWIMISVYNGYSIESGVMCKGFWDRQEANIASR